MQKTTFPIEVLIHDDASTDGTPDIIREYEQKYPEIIKPFYQKENQYSKGIIISQTYNIPRAQGKYIAFCEGDDYWTDPLKLQKQADLLEQNPDYGMCYGLALEYVQKNNKFLKYPYGKKYISTEDLILEKGQIPTLTVLLRIELLKQYYKEIKPEIMNFSVADRPLWVWFSHNSKIYFFDETFGVYRILEKSASHYTTYEEMINYRNGYQDIKIFFANLYNFRHLIEKVEDNKYLEFSYQAILDKKYFDYKKYINMVKNNSFKNQIKKFIGKSTILMILYHFYAITTRSVKL